MVAASYICKVAGSFEIPNVYPFPNVAYSGLFFMISERHSHNQTSAIHWLSPQAIIWDVKSQHFLHLASHSFLESVAYHRCIEVPDSLPR